jgi:hypothetical protein
MFTKEALLQHEAEQKAAKRGAEFANDASAQHDAADGINPERLAMINGTGRPAATEKNLSFKAEKWMRERRKRDLRRDERIRLTQELWPDSNTLAEKDLTPEQRKEKREAAKAENMRIQKEDAKKTKKEEKPKRREEEARTMAGNESDDEASSGDENTNAKSQTRTAESRKTKKQLAKEQKQALKKAKKEKSQTAAKDHNLDADIKFDNSRDSSEADEESGATSLPNNMTTAQYKAHLIQASRQKAMEVHALIERLRAKGDSITDEEKKQLKSEESNLKKQAAIRAYAIKIGLPESFAPPSMDPPNEPIHGSSGAPAVKPPVVKELSGKKKAKYAARAAEKGVSIEDYIARRAVKNAGKKGESMEPAEIMDVDQDTPLGLVADAASDAGLASSVPKIEIPASFGKLKLPLNPIIWEGRKSKLLTKEERKARLEYLRVRRSLRKDKKGVPSMVPKERRKKRSEGKTDMQDAEKLSSEELKDARRRAKKMLRAEKKGKEVGALPEEMSEKVDKKAKKQKQNRAK